MCDISTFCFGRVPSERSSEYRSARRVQTEATWVRSPATRVPGAPRKKEGILIRLIDNLAYKDRFNI